MNHKTLFGLLDKRYSLTYVSYDESLNGYEKQIQESIHTNEWCPLDEVLFEWEMNSRDSGLDYAFDELKNSIQSEIGDERFFDFDIDEYLEKYREEIEEEICNRDDSNFLHDLVRNTNNLVAFYSTGYSCGDTCFMDEPEWKETIREMRKALKIKGKEYDKQLSELLANAGYGGELVVYFLLEDFQNLIGIDVNTITFKSPHIALINTYNGSGHNVHLSNHVFSIPFERENLYLDKTIKYNYTYAVCGMSSNWCNDTIVNVSKIKLTKRLGKSFIGQRQKIDDELSAKYAKGECTYGDMDMHRHPQIKYTNKGTCGSYCVKCGTFWID